MSAVIGKTGDPNTAGVLGESTNETDAAGPGVHGVSKAAGVWGESATWHGVVGFSKSTTFGAGIYGKGLSGNVGAVGESTTGAGVQGVSRSGPGVFGTGLGTMPETAGVFGENTNETDQAGPGVHGKSRATGVWGLSTTWHGIYGETQSTSGAGVCGENKAGGSGVVGISNTGAGVYGKGGRVAGFFEGDVEVAGDIRLLAGSDCAEDFDITNGNLVEPGTVVVLGDDGTLQPSHFAYDKRVAGVVSGAGNYKPGIVLDNRGLRPNRKPVALLGKVYCKVDATFAPVEIGDLLTTSPTSGHAMKATDQSRAFGAVIGKALDRLSNDRGLRPVRA